MSKISLGLVRAGVVGLVLLVGAATAPARAAINYNSLMTNALTANALASNALASNGLTTNAINGNGFSANGLTGNALTHNAVSQNALSATGTPGIDELNGVAVDAVVLPPEAAR